MSLYDKGNYNATKTALTRAFIKADITITDRRYIGREDDTGYNHYAIDCGKCYDIAQSYEFEEE